MRLISTINVDLLCLYGKGYVIEHCIANFHKEQKDEQFRIYVANALETIAENTARFNGGKTMAYHYYDLLNRKEDDERTGQEIAEDVVKKAGLQRKEVE